MSLNNCVCKTCTCGKHRCGRPALPTMGMALESKTEYCDRFPAHSPQSAGSRLKKRPLQLHVNPSQHLSAATECKEQYTKKEIPKRFQPPKREYIPNASPLDNTTGYKQDFQIWKVPPPHRVSKVEGWKQTGEKIEDTTTSKANYTVWPTPPRPQRKKMVYQPNSAKFDGISNYEADFPPRQVSRQPLRPAEKFNPVVEDRDFKSQMRAAFIGYTGERPKREIIKYNPPNTTFEGETLYSAEYKVWPISKTLPTLPQQEKHLSSAPLESITEYNTVFVPKSAPRYEKKSILYTPNTAKFEGESTIRSDYRAVPIPQRVDFRPLAIWKNEPDARTFISETSEKHGLKVLPVCKIVEKTKSGIVSLQKQNDGHIYLNSREGLSV